jgi:hypothetical protein
LQYGIMQLNIYKFLIIIKMVTDALLRAKAKQIKECSLEREAINLLCLSFLILLFAPFSLGPSFVPEASSL